jgi:hypothetical protein
LIERGSTRQAEGRKAQIAAEAHSSPLEREREGERQTDRHRGRERGRQGEREKERGRERERERPTRRDPEGFIQRGGWGFKAKFWPWLSGKNP